MKNSTKDKNLQEKPDKIDKNKKILHPRYIFYGFLALLFGITISRSLYGGDGIFISIAVVSLLLIFVGLAWTKKFKMLAFMFAMFFIGNGLYFAGFSLFYGKEYSGDCPVVGRVTDNINVKENYTQIVLDNVKINGENSKNIVVTVFTYGKDFKCTVGDMLTFEGEVKTVSLFKENQFQSYYYRNHTPYSATTNYQNALVTNIDNNVRYDEEIRTKTRELLLANMSEKNANLSFAVLFGDKTYVDSDVKADYSAAGIYHILAVSGLHVGFLVALLYFLLKKCNRYIKFSVVCLILLLYNVLCGFAPSVMRASIMAITLLLAKLFGKEYDNLTALSFAGLAIVLISPLTALDVGFLMSYFSVAVIFLLNKSLSNILAKVMPKGVALSISVSLCAQIGILPFVASFYGQLNFLTIFANLIIIPMFSILFPVLFVLVLLALIAPFMGVFLHVVDWCFVAINYIANFFASTNLIINLKPWPFVFSMFYFLLLFALSPVLMISIYNRCVVVSILLLCLCLSYVMSQVWTPTILKFSLQTPFN